MLSEEPTVVEAIDYVTHADNTDDVIVYFVVLAQEVYFVSVLGLDLDLLEYLVGQHFASPSHAKAIFSQK